MCLSPPLLLFWHSSSFPQTLRRSNLKEEDRKWENKVVKEEGEMAEARSEEEEESVMRDTREQVVRRQPNASRGKERATNIIFMRLL